MPPFQIQSRPARSALTPTGGFLQDGRGGGYTHTFNPAVGCAYARGFCGSFCYARGFAERLGGRGTWGSALILKEGVESVLQAELERASRRPEDHPLNLSRLRIFSSSTTDPCAEPLLDTYRRCLGVVARHPPAVWVVQTRSPGVLQLEAEILALGDAAAVSFTLETDDEDLWRRATPGSPGIGARRRVIERLAGWPLPLHVALAPFLPLRDPEGFADWIARVADLATVDTFVSGDGSGGRRTAGSGLPAFLAALGHDWRDESGAHRFLDALRERMGSRAAWSAEGFLRLASARGPEA